MGHFVSHRLISHTRLSCCLLTEHLGMQPVAVVSLQQLEAVVSVVLCSAQGRSYSATVAHKGLATSCDNFNRSLLV